VHLGSGGQKLTATDLARLGRLWLRRGRWNGHQLVPASWLAAATSRHVTPPDGGFDYGYHFWAMTAAGHPAYAALGSGGQVVEVIPDLDLVAVVQSTSPSDPNDSTDTDTAPSDRYVEMIRDVIVPRIH
jgi:CubicO group peptidase (beta-lactamase class C family)